MSKHKPSDYIAIMLWGQRLYSHSYYIESQQALAAADGAPTDALYKTSEYSGKPQRWVCVSDLKPDHSFHTTLANHLERTAA